MSLVCPGGHRLDGRAPGTRAAASTACPAPRVPGWRSPRRRAGARRAARGRLQVVQRRAARSRALRAAGAGDVYGRRAWRAPDRATGAESAARRLAHRVAPGVRLRGRAPAAPPDADRTSALARAPDPAHGVGRTPVFGY